MLLAAAGLAEIEPGDEIWLWLPGLILLIFLFALVIACVFVLFNAIASLESREQRRFRFSKSLFESDRNEHAEPPSLL